MKNAMEQKIHTIQEDIQELKEGRKIVFEKLDKKIDKSDLLCLTTNIGKISASLEDARKERKSDLWKALTTGLAGLTAICGFFWYLSQETNTKIDEYGMKQYDFQLRTTEQILSLDKRTSVIENQLKNFELIK